MLHVTCTYVLAVFVALARETCWISVLHVLVACLGESAQTDGQTDRQKGGRTGRKPAGDGGREKGH